MNIHVVTLDWLKDSFLQEKRLSELKYVPLEARENGSVHSQRNKKRSHTVTKNIFMGGTFAIRAESFQTLDQSGIDRMEKVIIQNGGYIKDELSEAKFVIQEDGWDPLIWQGSNENEKQVVIHFRYIQECILQNHLLKYDDGLHLCPQPHKLPIMAF